MKKLFSVSLESGDNDVNPEDDLLIDKLINMEKKPKNIASLTTMLIKEKKELEEKLDENNDASGDEEKLHEELNEENQEVSNEESDKENQEEELEEPSSENKEEISEGNKEKIPEGDKEEESKDKEESDDDKEEKPDANEGNKEKDSKDKKGKVSTESLSPFLPLQDKYLNYIATLESLNMHKKALALESQPIVYLKDSVLKSLNTLIDLANSYIQNSEKTIRNNQLTAKSFNERFTIILNSIKNGNYKFTNKIIDDKEIIERIATTDVYKLRDTIKLLISYNGNIKSLIDKLLNNPFDKLESAFTNSEFVKDEAGDSYVYKGKLPGFNEIRAQLAKYQNYVKTQPNEYKYYKVHKFSIDEFYRIKGITIDEESELLYLVENAQNLVLELGLYTDKLNILNSNFNTFIEKIKALVYDIENGKVENLGELKIDKHYKSYILYKLILEIILVNIELIIDYLTTLLTVLDITVEL